MKPGPKTGGYGKDKPDLKQQLARAQESRKALQLAKERGGKGKGK
jgi:hypothetical protein